MLARCLFFLLLFVAIGPTGWSDDTSSKSPQVQSPAQSETAPAAPKAVDVEPAADDDQIAQRLTKILAATGWFDEPSVKVQDGVVFLDGTAATGDYKNWASDLVRNTQDVVAVVNRMQISRPAAFDFKPALNGLKVAWHAFLQNLPYLGMGICILLVTFFVLRPVQLAAQHMLKRRVTIPLVRELIARSIGVLVFLMGLYLVLKISGTTQLALTVLGGTGLFGLVLGIAFRDITENFLASIFLSMQRPFQIGDLVEIVGVTGYVDRLTIRTTVLVSLDGNYVQIPNATVYKNTIRNFTNNPKRRDDFTVYATYDKSVSRIQETVLKVLGEHPTVLKQPEPWVLVDRLNATTVELKVYFWIDCIKNNWLTVRSSVMRLSLHALREANLLSRPAPREVVFPRGLALHESQDGERSGREGAPPNGNQPSGDQSRPDDAPTTSTSAEGNLHSPRSKLTEQARPVEVGPDLLKVRK